ncbi:MAG: hypothetical protein COS94_04100, partial [Candidatus Hydrogenedentes bacterium CG07_land_8_20_14_0_80_42_17]
MGAFARAGKHAVFAQARRLCLQSEAPVPPERGACASMTTPVIFEIANWKVQIEKCKLESANWKVQIGNWKVQIEN